MTATQSCDEYQQLINGIRECRLSKAGLVGSYRTADCERGCELRDLALKGRGAYLWGEPGVGKTYAAACAVRLWVERSIGDTSTNTARFEQVARLLDEARQGYDGGDREVMRRTARYELLVLDDLGAERPTEWAMEELTALLDERTSRGLPTIVTSNYRLGELRDRWGGVPGKRLASRIAGACDVIEVTGPDRRLHG